MELEEEDRLWRVSMQESAKSQEDKKEIEPTADAISPAEDYAKSKKSYLYLKRELKEDELMNPGAINLLIDELTRLEEELMRARPYRDSFHKADKELAVFTEKTKKPVFVEILHTVAIGAGSLLIGASKTILEMGNVGTVILVAGVTLVVIALISKAVGLFR